MLTFDQGSSCHQVNSCITKYHHMKERNLEKILTGISKSLKYFPATRICCNLGLKNKKRANNILKNCHYLHNNYVYVTLICIMRLIQFQFPLFDTYISSQSKQHIVSPVRKRLFRCAK